ncbi:unnamed protein product [Triticum turgidum subsp. durum]|uniref:Protein kinase domain-containing protein n=1 Tax=Triticum turgidum subsp. durum TaxID=4567 RepID=A0A9R0XR32_TRITD|nr:unnamed protein product [Triticum turgidum subsp. durum]
MDYQGSTVRDFLHANGQVVLERVDNNHNLRSFTQKEIEDITGGYSTMLGEGGFGKVYKGKLDDLHPVAVKRYKNGTKKEEFAKEVIVHSQINHKNVVRLFGCCTEENALTIVMEFVCNGNLYNILHCSSSNANGCMPFPLDKRLDIAIESAEALSCMHSMYSPVLHGDIKPANILLDENFRPKISDFGIARLLAADKTQHTRHVIGCIGYMDPLLSQSGILLPKSDVYSFGVVLLEIITRKKAVEGNNNLAKSFLEAVRKGKKVRQMFDEEIVNDKKNMKFLEDIAKLAAECLKLEEKMRPEMLEVADRLRTIRKAYHLRKGRHSTGSNSRLTKSEKAEDVVPVVSIDELRKITRNFGSCARIGENIYGEIFLGVLKDGHNKSTIMKLFPSAILEVPLPLLSRFRHENVLQLLGYCVEENHTSSKPENRFLAYEYTSRGSLHDILHGKENVMGGKPGRVLSWAQRVKIALSAATGLEFLHEKAQPCVILTGIRCATEGYAQFSTESDVYSFGVVLLELLTGRKAVDPTLPRGQQYLVTWVDMQAARRLDECKVHQCVDPRLGGDYPPKAVAKMATIAALCIHYTKELRPKMSIVVKALRPLLLRSSSNLAVTAEASGV